MIRTTMLHLLLMLLATATMGALADFVHWAPVELDAETSALLTSALENDALYASGVTERICVQKLIQVQATTSDGLSYLFDLDACRADAASGLTLGACAADGAGPTCATPFEAQVEVLVLAWSNTTLVTGITSEWH